MNLARIVIHVSPYCPNFPQKYFNYLKEEEMKHLCAITVAIVMLWLPAVSKGETFQLDDFSTDTTANYNFVYYTSPIPSGSVGATNQIDYDAVNERAILYTGGGYGWSLMTPKEATPIPTTWDFEFSVDFKVLNEYVATLYLGDSSSSGPGIAFVLDTYADQIYVRQLMPDGSWLWPSPEPAMPYSGNSVALSVSRHDGLYEFAVNGEHFWSSTLDFLDPDMVYYGAQHWITSGPSGLTARTAVDNWNFHAAP